MEKGGVPLFSFTKLIKQFLSCYWDNLRLINDEVHVAASNTWRVLPRLLEVHVFLRP